MDKGSTAALAALAGVDASDVLQAGAGGGHVAFLLSDGRVCRAQVHRPSDPGTRASHELDFAADGHGSATVTLTNTSGGRVAWRMQATHPLLVFSQAVGVLDPDTSCVVSVVQERPVRCYRASCAAAGLAGGRGCYSPACRAQAGARWLDAAADGAGAVRVLVSTCAVGASVDVAQLTRDTPPPAALQPGLLLEVVHPSDPLCICLAEIIGMVEPERTVRLRALLAEPVEFELRADDAQLHPLGWCRLQAADGSPVQFAAPPGFGDGGLEAFVRQSNLQPAPSALLTHAVNRRPAADGGAPAPYPFDPVPSPWETPACDTLELHCHFVARPRPRPVCAEVLLLQTVQPLIAPSETAPACDGLPGPLPAGSVARVVQHHAGWFRLQDACDTDGRAVPQQAWIPAALGDQPVLRFVGDRRLETLTRASVVVSTVVGREPARLATAAAVSRASFPFFSDLVLQQVHPGMSFSAQARHLLETLMHDLLDMAVAECHEAARAAGNEPINFSHVSAFVTRVYEREVGRHGNSEASKAAAKHGNGENVLRRRQGSALGQLNRRAAGLQFPLANIAKKFMAVSDVTVGAVCAMAGSLEYLCAEIAELGGNAARTYAAANSN